MPRTRGRFNVLVGGLIGVALCVSAVMTVAGQEPFQFVVSATDSAGKPVTDLQPKDVLMSENGTANEIVKVEPFRIPVKLTIAVDNGPLSRDALGHYRSGLEGLVKALPDDVEVTLITIAPQPRRVVPPTVERERILRGINGFAPENASPRFTDAFVEFSKRYQDEFKKVKRFDSVPVLVMVSTNVTEASSYEVPEIDKALTFLQSRKARVFVTMYSGRQDVEGLSQIDTGRQAIIAIPATKATRGRYEPLANSSRLATLLPEFGADIAKLHNAHNNQVLVTARRKEGLKGPLQNPRIELARPGLSGQVSLDGLP
jgi:hypothetical protein